MSLNLSRFKEILLNAFYMKTRLSQGLLCDMDLFKITFFTISDMKNMKKAEHKKKNSNSKKDRMIYLNIFVTIK